MYCYRKDSMTKNLIVLVPVLALCLVALVPLATGAVSAESIPLEPGPVIIETTTEPTLLPTLTEPTTERTTVPTTEPTTEPTTRPTTVATATETTVVTITVGSEKGWIDVYCNVDGASVYFDNTYEGMTSGGILSVAVTTTATPITTVTVSKSGYKSDSESLSSMPKANQHVPVYTTLNPLTTVPTTVPPVQTGAIYVQSSPAGAAIYLNGNFQGYSPMTLSDLSPATYTMKATLSGYSPDTSLVNVYTGQTATYYPVLQLSPQPRQTGSVYITSTPSSASVYIDGSYYGKTPMTVSLYPGSHQVVLKLAGYNDYSTSVWVNAGQSQSLPISMSTAIYGSITVNSVPYAKVYMDSAQLGTTNSAGVFQQVGITMGNHLFKVTASGYNDWMNTVYVQANTVTVIAATLTPTGTSPTPAQPTGGLMIASSPSGADTYVDDLYRGITPVTVTDLTPGDHTIRLSATGYVDYTATTTVTSGQTMPLAITLSAAPTPTPTKSPAPELALVLGMLAAMLGICAYIQRR